MRTRRRTRLTKEEREWLGKPVRLPNGLVGEVWALGRPASEECPEGSLWVAANGRAYEVDIADITLVQNVDTPSLFD